MASADRRGPSLTELSAEQRVVAMQRFTLLRPIIEDEVSVVQAATTAGVATRTLHRWLAAYRRDGLAGLARRQRLDRGERRVAPEMVALIEGLALRRPRPSVAAIHRRVRAAAKSTASQHPRSAASMPSSVTWTLGWSPSRWRARPPTVTASS